ncbi:MAG: lipopolysaccharide assembly protein LapA domain-containing protein [Paracoccaceae bacterium]|nr:lipopolysaccharide assembly protein LapA domain-containing protein [Paracoccaceae bacterium]
MQTIKMAILGVIAAALILVGVANMASVDLYLVPVPLFGDVYSIKGIPLAVVILAAVLVGIVVGLVIEWLREYKHRRTADQKRREIVALRQEISRLRSKLGTDADDLPNIPAV